jgi:hypothetical protein
MTYGINLLNSAGDIMFSTEYMAYHYVGKFTAVNTVSFQCQASFSCVGTPIIFIDGFSGTAAVSLTELTNTSGSNWTATVTGRTLSNVGLTSIDIYVFAFPSTNTGSGYGIIAKNTNGNATLNTNQKLLKISGSYQTVVESSSTIDVPPSKAINFGTIPSNYIVCAPVLGEISSPSGPNRLLLAAGPYRVNVTTIGFWATFLYSPFAGAPSPSYRMYEQQYVLFADKTLYE